MVPLTSCKDKTDVKRVKKNEYTTPFLLQNSSFSLQKEYNYEIENEVQKENKYKNLRKRDKIGGKNT